MNAQYSLARPALVETRCTDAAVISVPMLGHRGYLRGPLIPPQNQPEPRLGGLVRVPSLSLWRKETVQPQVSEEDKRSLT